MSRPSRRPFPTLAAPCPNPGACSEPRHAIRRVEAAASSANIARTECAGQVTIFAQETFYKMFIVRASVSAAATNTVEHTQKKKYATDAELHARDAEVEARHEEKKRGGLKAE